MSQIVTHEIKKKILLVNVWGFGSTKTKIKRLDGNMLYLPASVGWDSGWDITQPCVTQWKLKKKPSETGVYSVFHSILLGDVI